MLKNRRGGAGVDHDLNLDVPHEVFDALARKVELTAVVRGSKRDCCNTVLGIMFLSTAET